MQTTGISQRLQSLALHAQTGDRLSPRECQNPGLDVSMATTPGERYAAGMLVARMYREAGYLDESHGESQPFFTEHHSFDQATVFIAREDHVVHGTVSVVTDSARGLPMESLYANELEALRSLGRSPCEVCSLAVSLEREKTSSKVFLQMFRQATLFLLHFTQATDAIVTLKPSHQHFYERCLGFVPFGQPVRDARFKEADTVAMRITREKVTELYASAETLKRRQRLLLDVYTPPRSEELRRLGAGLSSKNTTPAERLARQRRLLAVERVAS